MKKPGLLDQFGDWIETLPAMVRLPIYGSMLVVIFLLTHGAWIALPIAVAWVFATSPHPWSTLATGAKVVWPAVVGGVFCTFAYLLFGRRLLRAAFAGNRKRRGR